MTADGYGQAGFVERLRSDAVVVSFWVWSAILSFQFLTFDWEVAGSSAFAYQVIGLFQFVAIAGIALGARIPSVLAGYHPLQLAILTVVFLSIALQLHGDAPQILTGIGYTLALITTTVLLSALATLDQRALTACFAGKAIVLIAFAPVAFLLFGLPEGRKLGGIHPNQVGQVMLFAFVFSLFWRHAFMLAIRTAAVVVAASVSSRYAVIGCLLSLVVFELTYRPLSSRLIIMVGLATVAVVFMHDQFVDLLALNDPTRNLDSGLSGREDQWTHALKALSENPLGMGFKRPSVEEAGHNGYFKALLEFGIPGGGIIIAAILGIVVTSALTAVWLRGSDERRRFAAARTGGLAALTFAAFFEPQMFNLGDNYGISFLLLLFWPGLAAGHARGAGAFIPHSRVLRRVTVSTDARARPAGTRQ